MPGPAEEETRAGPGFSLRPPTAAALNHLLKNASWALARLQPFAGRTARFELAPFTIAYTIRDNGEVAEAATGARADAIFTLTPAIALRMLAGDTAAWQAVSMTGDSALSREILAIAQNLRWDVEEDLSRVVGDIAAHRLVAAANGLRRWQRDSTASFTRSLAAYWTEEQPLVASKPDVEHFVRAVDTLRDDVARLEKRVASFAARGVRGKE